MSEPAFRNYHIALEYNGWALIAVLRQVRSGDSVPECRLIQNRHVQINGNLSTDEGRKLKVGDVVKVWKSRERCRPGPRM